MQKLFWNPGMKPLLSSAVDYYLRDGQLVLETREHSYCFEDPSREILAPLLPLLDGENEVQDLALRVNRTLPEIVAHLDVLAEDDLLVDTDGPSETTSAPDLIAAYFRKCRFHGREILAQPFWRELLSGKAPLSLIWGWGVEFFHYVESANEHMAASVAHCRHDHQLRAWLAEHYVEEYNHSEIFLKGLESSGFDPYQVQESPPLPSTLALINFLTELATSDTLAYTAAFGVMQFAREKTTAAGINEFYDQLSVHYPPASPFFSAVRKHALIDVDLDHQELILQRLLERQERIDPPTTQRIMRAVLDTTEHFILFFEGIYDYYFSQVPIPRSALNITSLL